MFFVCAPQPGAELSGFSTVRHCVTWCGEEYDGYLPAIRRGRGFLTLVDCYCSFSRFKLLVIDYEFSDCFSTEN